jgi:hypothetical protein
LAVFGGRAVVSATSNRCRDKYRQSEKEVRACSVD